VDGAADNLKVLNLMNNDALGGGSDALGPWEAERMLQAAIKAACPEGFDLEFTF